MSFTFRSHFSAKKPGRRNRPTEVYLCNSKTENSITRDDVSPESYSYTQTEDSNTSFDADLMGKAYEPTEKWHMVEAKDYNHNYQHNYAIEDLMSDGNSDMFWLNNENILMHNNMNAGLLGLENSMALDLRSGQDCSPSDSSSMCWSSSPSPSYLHLQAALPIRNDQPKNDSYLTASACVSPEPEEYTSSAGDSSHIHGYDNNNNDPVHVRPLKESTKDLFIQYSIPDDVPFAPLDIAPHGPESEVDSVDSRSFGMMKIEKACDNEVEAKCFPDFMADLGVQSQLRDGALGRTEDYSSGENSPSIITDPFPSSGDFDMSYDAATVTSSPDSSAAQEQYGLGSNPDDDIITGRRGYSSVQNGDKHLQPESFDTLLQSDNAISLNEALEDVMEFLSQDMDSSLHPNKADLLLDIIPECDKDVDPVKPPTEQSVHTFYSNFVSWLDDSTTVHNEQHKVFKQEQNV